MKIRHKRFLLVVGGIFAVLFLWPFLESFLKISLLERTTNIPTFTSAKLEFTHIYTDPTHWPAVGGTVFDSNGDGTPEVFIGGGTNQSGVVFSYSDGKVIDRTEEINFAGVKGHVYDAETTDVDLDGDDDVLLIRDEELFLYVNTRSGFEEYTIPLPLDEKTIPLSVAVGRINGDSFPDLYISTFMKKTLFRASTFNDPEHKTANIALRNNRNYTFSDITASSGLAFSQNTFYARFADLNSDNLEDLIVVPNTDQVRVYKNQGSGSFELADTLGGFGFWMGIAVADIDNDGDNDFFVSNAGKTVPQFLLSGDETPEQTIDTSWRFFRNDGDFVFTDITKPSGVDIPEWAWGSEFADFNQDGRADLIVMENFINWPLHKYFPNPGRLLIQDTKGRFVATEGRSGVTNRFFGLVPLVVDLNSDSFPDVVFLNQKGPAQVFVNNGAN